MVNHRAQAQFERARWKALYLIPLWSIQLVLSMLLLGLFSRRLSDTVRSTHKEDAAGAAADTPVITIVWESLNIAMSFVLGLCTAVDVAKYFAETLTPVVMLLTNATKLVCAITILALDVVVYVQRRDQQYSLVGLVVDTTLLIATATSIVYAAVAHKRSAAYDAYSLPVNVKGFGFSDGLSYYSDGSYSSRLSMRSSVEKPARPSFGSIRTASASSELHQHQQQRPQQQKQQQQQQQQPLMSPPSEPMFQTASGQYNHERSTKFEEFMSLYGPLHRSSEPDTAYRSQTQGLGFREARTVGRPRGASTGSRGKSVSGEQVLRSVPEEDADVVEVAAARSADGTGSDVSTASAPLMSGSEHDEFIVIKKRTSS